MDNLSAHHYEGGEILEVWLEEMGIELIYLPTYSPDLNPIEFCFNKVKTLLNGEFQELTHTNTKLILLVQILLVLITLTCSRGLNCEGRG